MQEPVFTLLEIIDILKDTSTMAKETLTEMGEKSEAFRVEQYAFFLAASFAEGCGIDASDLIVRAARADKPSN